MSLFVAASSTASDMAIPRVPGIMKNYSEIQDFLMKEFRLMHLPIAVKFIFEDEELQDFKKWVEGFR